MYGYAAKLKVKPEIMQILGAHGSCLSFILYSDTKHTPDTAE